MDYTEKTFPLKNGKTCLIRRPEAADAERVLRYQKETSGETPYLVVGPEDIGLTVEEQAERIQRWNACPSACVSWRRWMGSLRAWLSYTGAASRAVYCIGAVWISPSTRSFAVWASGQRCCAKS